MSFLNRLGKMFNGDGELSPRTAFALAAISMVAADGIVEDEEIGVLMSLHSLDGETLKNASRRFRKFGCDPNRCVEPVAQVLNREQQETALAVMFDIAMSDGDLADDEKQLLEAYMKHFEVDEALVENIAEMIAIKNRPVFGSS